MNIIIRNPSSELATMDLFRPMDLFEFEEMSRDLWESWMGGVYKGNFLPATDIYEEKDNLVVKAELPGVNKEDIDITVEGDRLIIQAERKEEKQEDVKYHAREQRYGSYCLSTTLPLSVNSDKASAVFENGVLELRLPKSEEARGKKIEVKAQLPPEQKKRERKPKQIEHKES